MAITSFNNKETEEFFLYGKLKKNSKWQKVSKVTMRKLDILNYAETLEDLRSPPGNRLESLKGNWQGWYSIRINNQWRIIFQWTSLGPTNVCITDYH